MTNEELKHKIADIVADLDTIIDNPEVPVVVTAFVNQAANYLAQAYVSLPGRFNTDGNS